jgi:gliding motility-associated-like protein
MNFNCGYKYKVQLLQNLKNRFDAMKFYFAKLLFFLCFILRGVITMAQPANDNCDNAIEIRDPRNYCSNNEQFTNVGATASTISAVPFCLSANGNDVWFSFRAMATDVRITVQGATASGATGTLRRPEGGLYGGNDCTSISEIAYKCDNTSQNIIEIYKGALIVGDVYYIRVQGFNRGTGTFKLCIVNYNPPANITSDCPTSTTLCDKSTFSVQSVTGAGTNTRELDDALCFRSSSGQNSGFESNSTWFKWTCETSGTLTFAITPFNLNDDIDFVVYKLGDINSCAGKTVVRCMAAGEGSSTLTPCTPVWGATGLRVGETDISEGSGCGSGQNGFLRPIDMVAGEIYALAINNFTNTGNGFKIDFGGSGTFAGPVAKINYSKPSKRICLGEDIDLTDASTFANGRIASRKWRFGKGATVDSASGTGPFRVFYKTPGWKSIVLTVTSDRGCQVTTILDSIFVEGFKYDTTQRRPTCRLGNDGMIRLKVTNCGRAPILYDWENLGYTTRDSITGLRPGTYRVAVTDSSRTYIDTVRFTLKEDILELARDSPSLKQPTCFGFTNGSIAVHLANGKAPFEYNFGRGWTLDSTLCCLGTGSYTIQVRDAFACRGDFTFDVVAPPAVAVTVDSFNISCFGLADGKAVARPSGGVGNYRINWSSGSLRDTVVNLKAGSYNVTVYDGNSCPASRSFTVQEPPQIFLSPSRIKEAKCYGDSTGELVVRGSGGTPPYRYSIDGVRFQRDSAFLSIPAKDYQVVVRDSTGCKATFSVKVPQPPLLQVSAGPDLEVDLGSSAALRAIVVPSSKQVSYAWTPADSTLSCKNCPNVTILPLQNTLYRISIVDSTKCTAFDEVLIRVNKRRPVYIPNVFSPNGDGVNDWFTAWANNSAVRINRMEVFNRWGGKLYQGQGLQLNSHQCCWNGTFENEPVPAGVYVYLIEIEFIDGEKVLFKGDINVLR